MALVTRYVDPDASGSGTGVDWTNAYTSLNAWEAAEQTDLVTDTDSHIVYCRASSGSNDTTAGVISGWTTGASNDITIEGNDFPTDGIWDDSKYNLRTSDTITFAIYEDYVTLNKMQIAITVTADNAGTTIYLNQQNPTTNKIIVSNCILKCLSAAGTGHGRGLLVQDSDLIMDMYNCVVSGYTSASDTTDFVGIRLKGRPMSIIAPSMIAMLEYISSLGLSQ